MRRRVVLPTLALFTLVSIGFAQTQKKTVKAPLVTGEWSGVWGLYSPPELNPTKPQDSALKPPPQPHTAIQMKMDCKVVSLGEGKWEATFEGDAGRPYKYTIKMPGRQVGGVVLFKGTADLGEKDGGVYDWIGRATEKEFVGFFTSQGYTGSFRLARPK